MRPIRPIFIALLITGQACDTLRAGPPDPVSGSAAGPSAAVADSLSGTILERLDASSYSYLRLSTGSGEIWAAVPQTTLTTGAVVEIVNPQHMDGFESRTLQRKFDRIVFGNIAGAAGSSSAGASAAMAGSAAADGAPSGNPHGAQGAKATDAAPIAVPRAEGPTGRTVAELFAQKDSLKETAVSVRGQVVKANLEILDRNWIHLRDGTGSDSTGDNDITVTTKDTAKVGDVVEIKGTLRLEKDFGAGYVYDVIVEDAVITK